MMTEFVTVLLLLVLLYLSMQGFQGITAGLFLWPSTYAVGVRVFRETRPLPQPELPPGTMFETESGRFKVISQERCLFESQPKGFFAWVVEGYCCFFKGRLLWTGGRATAEARIPISKFLSYVVMLTVLTFHCVFMMPQKYGQWNAAAATLLVWALMAFIVFREISITKNAVKTILDEYEALVTEKARHA